MQKAIPVAVALLLMVLCAFVNGYWTDRWGASYGDALIQDYAQRLDAVPISFGDWVGKDQEVTEDGAMQLKAAHIVKAIQRTYTNQKTEEQVSVFLATGPQRHLAVHTPNSCYVAAGYDMAGAPAHFPIEIPADLNGGTEGVADFYVAAFRKDESAASAYRRVFWSWNAGSGWLAPDYPKWKFAWDKALYKLYVEGEIQKRGNDLRDDPRVEFLREFIPLVDKALALPADGSGEQVATPAGAPATGTPVPAPAPAG